VLGTIGGFERVFFGLGAGVLCFAIHGIAHPLELPFSALVLSDDASWLYNGA
jgi:hypothetical protein